MSKTFNTQHRGTRDMPPQAMRAKSAKPPTLSIEALAACLDKRCTRSRQELQHFASRHSRHASTKDALEVGKTSTAHHRGARGMPPLAMHSKSAKPPRLSIEAPATCLHKRCPRSRQDLLHSPSEAIRSKSARPPMTTIRALTTCLTSDSHRVWCEKRSEWHIEQPKCHKAPDGCRQPQNMLAHRAAQMP